MNFYILVDADDFITGRYAGTDKKGAPWVSVTQAQYAGVFPGSRWINPAVVMPVAAATPSAFSRLQAQAKVALAASDATVLRCAENGVTVPAAWVGYRAELRNIVNGTNGGATSLPTKPSYPVGT